MIRNNNISRCPLVNLFFHIWPFNFSVEHKKRQSLGFLFSLEKCLTTMDGLKYLFLEDRDQPFPSWIAELEDVLECPVCRGRLANSRSLAFEKLLAKLPKTKCRYEDCQFKRADVDVVYQHEIGCLFRLVECGNCQDGIPMSKLSDHLSTDHNLPSLNLKQACPLKKNSSNQMLKYPPEVKGFFIAFRK